MSEALTQTIKQSVECSSAKVMGKTTTRLHDWTLDTDQMLLMELHESQVQSTSQRCSQVIFWKSKSSLKSLSSSPSQVSSLKLLGIA